MPRCRDAQGCANAANAGCIEAVDAKSGICTAAKWGGLRIFCLALGLLAGFGALADCLPEGETETASVKYVHDGDTVILTNGRKLRVIGVDTPELGDNRRPAEPLAVEARDFIRDLLREQGNKIKLHYDRELTDAYQRQLAHVFLPDDRSLSEILLQQGLATALTVPPNVLYSNCYALAENGARRNGKGLWALSRYRPVAIGQLRPKTSGFRIVRGDVLRVRRHRQADYIYVGEPGAEQVLRVKIAAEDRPFFETGFLKTLTDKRVEIRGWIHHENGRFFARIRYPTALQIPSP